MISFNWKCNLICLLDILYLITFSIYIFSVTLYYSSIHFIIKFFFTLEIWIVLPQSLHCQMQKEHVHSHQIFEFDDYLNQIQSHDLYLKQRCNVDALIVLPYCQMNRIFRQMIHQIGKPNYRKFIIQNLCISYFKGAFIIH